MFSDKKSVVDSSMTPNGETHERHVALSFQHVVESIAAEIDNYQFIDGKINPVDLLSKY